MERDQLSINLAVILHADVVGSTAHVRTNEVLAHERFQETFHKFSETIGNHFGVAHEIRGDALVAGFARASDAVSASLEFQIANSMNIETIQDDIKPEVRIGIAIGEVVVADNTVTGEGIVIAQRLEQFADPGGIIIQGAVFDTLPKRLPFNYLNLGELKLKGFDDPIRAFSVVTGDDAGKSILEKFNKGETSLLKLPDKPSIAVLPFENMSDDREQEYFADGISEDIITELSKFRSFFIIARNSSFSFKKEGHVTVKDVGEKLGVRYVVEGSVRRAGNRARITAQLVDAVDDKHLWAERYDRDLEDIFLVQDEVTRAIVTAIEPQLSITEQRRARRKPPENLDAWECYQRGLWYMFGYIHMDQALHFFQRAIELDPEFASAYAGIAYTYAINIFIGRSEDHERDIKLGVKAAETALGLDNSNPFANFAQGRISIFKAEHDKAIAAFKRAISLNPNYALAHWGLGHGLWHAGRPEEALDHIDDAIRLSPHDPVLWAFLASKSVALIMLGHYEEGIEVSLEAQSYANANFYAWLAEVSGLGLLGKRTECAAAIDRLNKVQPDISVSFIEQSIPIAESKAKDRFLRGFALAGLNRD